MGGYKPIYGAGYVSGFFLINETLTSLTEYGTGSVIITGALIFMLIVILIELTEMPAQGKIGVYMLAALALSTTLGFPAMVSGLILVLGGIYYFFLLRDTWRG